LVGIVLGGAAVWAAVWAIGPGSGRLPGAFDTAGPVPERSRDQLSSLSREKLEAEVQRLERLVDARDKQIADLTIQLKLMDAGSGSPQPEF
jgi:hypothetical protein